MGQRVNKTKLTKLQQKLRHACCAGCGQALVRGDVEPVQRTLEQNAIIWPIAIELAKRSGIPPNECPKYGRAIERYD